MVKKERGSALGVWFAQKFDGMIMALDGGAKTHIACQ